MSHFLAANKNFVILYRHDWKFLAVLRLLLQHKCPKKCLVVLLLYLTALQEEILAFTRQIWPSFPIAFKTGPTSSLLSMFFIQFLEFLNSCFDCLLFHTQLCPIIEMFKLFLVRLFFCLLLMAETFIEVIIQRNVRQLFFYNEIFEYPLVCKSMFESLMCSRRKVFFDMFL